MAKQFLKLTLGPPQSEIQKAVDNYASAVGVLLNGAPATSEEIKTDIQNLTDAANAKTSNNDTNLADAVDTLMEGYGKNDSLALQEKTVTENGEVTFDEGYDGLGKVIVNIPAPKLQQKTATQNGEIAPDETYDGLSKVIVNVPNPPLQTKTITSNGEVVPDQGYYGFSKIIVDVLPPDSYWGAYRDL